MNHRKGFNPLSRTTAHRRAMSRNMVTSLFRYERITTTRAKAMEVRKAAEKLITRGKVDSVHNRRQVARYIADAAILAKLFTDIAPRMKERHGGYTRVLKLGFRQGDAADVVILELVDYKFDAEKTDKKEKTDKAESKITKPTAAKAKAAPVKAEKAKSEGKAETDVKAKAKKSTGVKAEEHADTEVKPEDKAE